MTWLVLGGSGFVGSSVVQALQSAGQQVESSAAPRLTTSAELPEDLAREARASAWVDQLAAGMTGVSVVVLAAGVATPDAPDSASLRGGNALLPAVVALACDRAGVPRMLHLSSAAVQGRRPVLDESATVRPFSPYSRSKATGEQVLAQLRKEVRTELVVVRATSVQGAGRRTTESLRRVARSPITSVAGSGSQPSPVSSVGDLAGFLVRLGSWPEPLPALVLQPWAGLSVADVLHEAGNRPPRRLPAVLCRLTVAVGFAVSSLLRGRLDGPLRRVEAMWFGQEVDDAWARAHGLRGRSDVGAVLSGAPR